MTRNINRLFGRHFETEQDLFIYLFIYLFYLFIYLFIYFFFFAEL